ncbi:MAG TPA: response regulator transcription factor [Leptolyngbyaceae cyanobacterium]
MIRLVTIEDNDLLRIGITTAINEQDDMKMVGTAEDGTNGIKLVQELNPDIVLVDLGLPDISGVEVIQQIKFNNNSIKIAVLSSYCDQDFVESALNAGADSYILKKTNVGLIVEGIKATHNNKRFFDSEIAKRGFHSFSKSKRIKGKVFEDTLTCQEIKVLGLLAAGFSNREIGKKLFIGESTVKNHNRNIYSKLGVESRMAAIVKGCELGYISSDILKVSQSSLAYLN